MPDQLAIVEDDSDQRSLLERGLRHRGFSVVAYEGRPSAARAFAAGEIPELAILDVNLNGDDPDDRDGFELCRELLALPTAETGSSWLLVIVPSAPLFCIAVP